MLRKLLGCCLSVLTVIAAEASGQPVQAQERMEEARTLAPRALGPARPNRPPNRSYDATSRDLPRPDASGPKVMQHRVIRMQRLTAPVAGRPGDKAVMSGGLGAEAWRGTQNSLIPKLIAAQPVGAPSPTMGFLVQAVLKTPGPVVVSPAQANRVSHGWGTAGANKFTEASLGSTLAARLPQEQDGEDIDVLRRRMQGLLDAGQLEAVSTQISGFDKESRAVLADIHAASLLLQDKAGQACDLALDHRLESDAPFWIQLRAFCYLQDNARPAAQLTADLLKERGLEAPVFFALVRHLASGEELAADDLNGVLNPITFSLLRMTGRYPPAQVLETASPAILSAFVVSNAQFGGSGSDQILLALAQNAVMAGALAPEKLRELYARIGFPAHEPGQMLDFAASLPPELVLAFFYQKAEESAVPALRIEILHEALGRADEAGAYIPAVLAYGDLVKALEPAPPMAWAAGRLGLASLLLGDAERAVRWYEMLKLQTAQTVTEAQMADRDRLALAIAVADERAARMIAANQGRDLGIERRIARVQSGEESPQRLSRDLQILNATGMPLPTEAEIWLFDQGQDVGIAPPPVSVTARLADAVNKRRTAEAIALALMIAGKQGPQSDSPYFLAQSIRALSVLGLTREARRLALEAIFARQT